jgi:hypoxanthine phosphoribosyltransferase
VIKSKSQLLISEEKLVTRIGELAREITEEWAGRVTPEDPLLLMVVLDGASVFYSRLVRLLALPLEVELVKLQSYSGTESTHNIELLLPWQASPKGRHVLII